jgi:hypothetical protein
MNIFGWTNKRSRSTARRSTLSRASISEAEWEERRRSASDSQWQVYHRRTEEERLALAERQAAEGMVDLGVCCAVLFVCVCVFYVSTAPSIKESSVSEIAVVQKQHSTSHIVASKIILHV